MATFFSAFRTPASQNQATANQAARHPLIE